MTFFFPCRRINCREPIIKLMNLPTGESINPSQLFHYRAPTTEYKVYERLYGEPIFVDTAEELLQEPVTEEEIIEEELPDGSTIV